MIRLDDSCRRIGSDLSAYFDDELSPRQRRAVQRHLAGCGECREALGQLRLVSGWVSVLGLAPIGTMDGAAPVGAAGVPWPVAPWRKDD